MEDLIYKVEITAPAKKVWDTMLQDKTYRQWSGKAWPGSLYLGEWKEGTEIKFTGEGGGGTAALLEIVKPYSHVFARHIALLTPPDNVYDRDSEQAKTWVGITEEYRFVEMNGKTTLTVLIKTPSEWKSMFDEGWPVAIEELKRLVEAKNP